MRFGSYHFTGIFQETAELPPYKGSTFRGSFGQALRKTMQTETDRQSISNWIANSFPYETRKSKLENALKDLA